jgi:hypothetical protein
MRTFYHLLLFASCLLLPAISQAQTVNIESALRYWEITDALRRDEPLTDQVWRNFLALPGNRIYVDAVYSQDQLALYRRAIEVVYMPRYDSLRQAKLKAKSWLYRLANDYKEHESGDKRYLIAMQQHPDYLGRMYTYAYEALPTRNHAKVANLKLYYVVLGNDATSQAEGMVFSLRDVRDCNAVKPGMLEAHEMHHQLRLTRDYGTTDPVDDNLLWAFYVALNEGTADLTDKEPSLALPLD